MTTPKTHVKASSPKVRVHTYLDPKVHQHLLELTAHYGMTHSSVISMAITKLYTQDIPRTTTPPGA